MGDVIKEIRAVLEGSDLLEEQMLNIIMKHPIRMQLLFQCQQLCSWQDWFCRHQCQYHVMSIILRNSLYLYCTLNMVYISPFWFTNQGVSAVYSKLLFNQEFFMTRIWKRTEESPFTESLFGCTTTSMNSLVWKTLWLDEAAQQAVLTAGQCFQELLGHLRIVPCRWVLGIVYI